MRAITENYMLTCPDSQQLKPPITPKPGLLQGHPVPLWIWTDITADFIVGPPEVKGYDTLYVFMDMFSTYTHFIPGSSSDVAGGVAQLFVNYA